MRYSILLKEGEFMGERKYQFRKPSGPDQHLEALYEELSLSPKRGDYRPVETVKDKVDALLDHAKTVRRERKQEKESDSYAVTWAIGALAFVSLIFLFNGYAGSGDWEWLNNHRFAIRLWGIVFAAVVVGVSIEQSSFFKSLWAFGFTKLVASIAASAVIVFSTGKASSLINAVFSVDASALPFTRAIVTGLLVFQYAYPLLLVVVFFAILHALKAADWISVKFFGKGTYESPPLQSMLFLVLSIVILAFSARWTNADFSDAVWPQKIYRLAHILDFNSQHECKNLPKDISVVFLGPEQARVLVDISSPNTDDMESFVDGTRSGLISVPKKFQVLPCEFASSLQMP
jgi:hypothetical protein